MTTQSDILIGRLAVERGIVSAEQVAECLSEQRAPNPSPLGAIMVRKGLLKPHDLDTLLEEQKKRLADASDISDPKLEDALLGRLLIKQGLAKESQVYECLRTQAEMGEKGETSPRLGELLVRKGFLTSDAVDTALLLHRRRVFICPSCGSRFSTAGTEAGKKYHCKQCGCILERHEQTVVAGETTGAVRIDIPDDAAQAAQDPARKFAEGRYILIKEVGRGGMGVVWKAWQTDLRRYVAIKILVGTMWTEVELKRFYREAQMAASLSHTNIASIFEVGSCDGKHFIAMEFVDGESLAQLMAPPSSKTTARMLKHLPPRRAIEVVRDAALAVDYAHSKRIIHRDLKPHNIMVQRSDGRVYVMDFGLAKPIRTQDSITVSDAIVGTPQYMSPEQARGDALDRRTDVYSLGAVLFHVLTGRPPFEGRSPAETMMAVLADDPEPLRKLNPRLHADLETIAMKALDKDRHRRYDSARSLADDLSRYLEGEPISARPLSARERIWREMRRHPIVSSLIGAGVAAALLIGLVLLGVSLQTEAKIQELRDKANVAYERRNYEDAKSNWEKVLVLAPDHPIALQLIELIDGKILEKAEREKKLKKIEQEDIEHLRARADALYRAGQYDKAVLDYERLATLDALDDTGKQHRAKCFEEIERQKVIQEEIKRQAANSQEALLKLTADLQAREDRRKKARPWYEQARQFVEIASQMKLEGEGAYTIREVLTKYRDALQAITRAMREDPGYMEAIYFRGTIHHKLGRYADADKDFRSALALNKEFYPAWFGSAMAQLALFMTHAHTPYEKDAKARDDALNGMNVAAEEARKSTDPFEHWCGIALQKFFEGRRDKSRYEEAAEDVAKVSAEGRGRYFYHFILACVYLESNNLVESRREYTAALDLLPTSLEALFLNAVVRTKREDLAGAHQEAGKAVESAPAGNFLVYLLRASISEAIGDKDAAVRDLEQAATLAAALPDGPAAKLQRKIVELKKRT